MSEKPRIRSDPSATPKVTGPTDQELVLRLASGDEAALRLLMDRYDRLVRFAVFRMARSECRRDPQWLDSRATGIWQGFIQSMKRAGNTVPNSLKTYLLQVSRNHVISALRRKTPPWDQGEGPKATTEPDLIEATDCNPSVIVEELDSLSTLRDCISGLNEGDQALLARLEEIVNRRWVEAAGSLGMKESTLRSRWKRLLDDLRACVEGKTGG